MAYTKHEWVTGEIITATNLNHMEDGIASKLDASAVVNSQEADTPGTALDAMQGNPDVPGSLAAQIKEAGESSKAIVLTQAQYDALTDEEKDSDNVYYISDAPFESSNVVPLTRAEYDALSDATKMDGRFYYITDEAEVAKSLVVQNNVNSTETVPSSAVVYGLKSDTDSQISELTGNLSNLFNPSYTTSGLILNDCTISDGGYCIIGKFLYINMKITPTATDGIHDYVDFSNVANVRVSTNLNVVNFTNDNGPYYGIMHANKIRCSGLPKPNVIYLITGVCMLR